MVAGNIEDAKLKVSNQSPAVTTPRNLKKNAIVQEENPILSTWNELQGLSERELITTSTDSLERQQKALDIAYRRCEYVTELFSKTFYMGTTLMRRDLRKHVWAIYTWCRRTDDLVDSPRALLNRDHLEEDLTIWHKRLDRIWEGSPEDLFDLAMSNTVQAFPGLKIQPFRDMIAGMIMDVPGVGKDRYQNFEELYLYCYRVAGTVGLMTLPILGAAKGYTEEEAAEPAIALGIAFQLTNILRDVGEDLERGRIYLPKEELDAFGITEEDLFSCEVTNKYKEFTKFQIARARDYYRKAHLGVQMLAPDARIAVQASLDLYSRILSVIERNGYDNFRKRAYTTKLEKLSILPGSIIAATFPKKT
jgi:15-cis-phytoene synthase